MSIRSSKGSTRKASSTLSLLKHSKHSVTMSLTAVESTDNSRRAASEKLSFFSAISRAASAMFMAWSLIRSKSLRVCRYLDRFSFCTVSSSLALMRIR